MQSTPSSSGGFGLTVVLITLIASRDLISTQQDSLVATSVSSGPRGNANGRWTQGLFLKAKGDVTLDSARKSFPVFIYALDQLIKTEASSCDAFLICENIGIHLLLASVSELYAKTTVWMQLEKKMERDTTFQSWMTKVSGLCIQFCQQSTEPLALLRPSMETWGLSAIHSHLSSVPLESGLICLVLFFFLFFQLNTSKSLTWIRGEGVVHNSLTQRWFL